MSKDEFMDEVSQRVTCVLIFATYSNLIDLISGSFSLFQRIQSSVLGLCQPGSYVIWIIFK